MAKTITYSLMFESGEKIFIDTGEIIGKYAGDIMLKTTEGHTIFIPEKRITCIC